jgi:sulfur relay (sulfurtransferase) DsrC/TusE family protein
MNKIKKLITKEVKCFLKVNADWLESILSTCRKIRGEIWNIISSDLKENISEFTNFQAIFWKWYNMTMNIRKFTKTLKTVFRILIQQWG